MIALPTVEDFEAMDGRLRVVEGNQVKLRKDFDDLILELKAEIKQKAK